MLSRAQPATRVIGAFQQAPLRHKHSLAGDDYQFLHKSEIPSYHFQKSLRRLPIPKLPDSCNRYLAAAKVVLSPEQFSQAERLVRDFEKTEGPVLQAALLDYDKAHKSTSYISETWFDIYLRARVPLPVNYNPFLMYAPDPNSKYNNQLARATNLVISFARIKRALDAEVIAPEVFHLNPEKSDTQLFRNVCRLLPPSLSWFGAVAFKAFPLDMSQYKSLFNGTRIPKREKDVLYYDPTQKHFVAMHKGRFFAVRLFDDNDKILPAEQVQASIDWVLQQPPLSGGAEEAVGSLTSLERNAWADLRKQLEDEGNSGSLRKIDGALFALCLDDLKTEDHTRLTQSLLVGDDASNRWFDKCFQLIVDGNGMATLNFEHSWGDGVAVLRLLVESLKDTNKHHFVDPDGAVQPVTQGDVQEIKFSLSQSMKSAITDAQAKHVSVNSDLDFAPIQYSSLNRDSIKKHKISPDSFVQLAIQIAYYSLYKEFAPTYESCSTAAFLKGRTECIRSATAATQEATLAVVNGTTTDIFPLLQQCSNVHSQLVKEGSMGQGFDRHILGLKITAERLGKTPHEFFSSEAHNRMGHFILSTSTLSSDATAFGGFGPVVGDGFGIGYDIVPSRLGAVITSYKSKRSASAFASALEKSLDQLKTVLDKKSS